MAELGIEAITVAVDEKPGFVPAAMLPDAGLCDLALRVAELSGVPAERMAVLPDVTDGTDVCSRALAELGPPQRNHPLYLVRSGPDPDPFVAALPRVTNRLGWVTRDLGLTHLDERGGTAVFELLSWAVDPLGASVVVVDQPVFVDTDDLPPALVAVAFRVRRGPAPVRVLAWGEDSPAWEGVVFDGPGPCDAWLGLHEALRAGVVEDGTRVLLHARGAEREGWALLEIADAAGVVLGGGDD